MEGVFEVTSSVFFIHNGKLRLAVQAADLCVWKAELRRFLARPAHSIEGFCPSCLPEQRRWARALILPDEFSLVTVIKTRKGYDLLSVRFKGKELVSSNLPREGNWSWLVWRWRNIIASANKKVRVVPLLRGL